MQNRGMGLGAPGLGCGESPAPHCSSWDGLGSCYRGMGGRFEGLWGGVCEEMWEEAEQHQWNVLPTAHMSPAQGSLASGVG